MNTNTNTNAALADAAEAKADAILNPSAVAGHNQSPEVQALWRMAMSLGVRAAAGQSAVTKLAFGFQRMVADGSATEDMAAKLYAHHVAGHNAWVAKNPELGGRALGTSDEELKSSISTFRTFAKKGPREMGTALYDRVRTIRQHSIPEDEWAQKSAYNAFVKVNRMVHGLCAKLDVSAFPTITDADLVKWLRKEPKDVDDFARAYEAMRKAVEKRQNGDPVLAEAFRLLARYRALTAASLPLDMGKLVEGTDFTWTAPIVSKGNASE